MYVVSLDRSSGWDLLLRARTEGATSWSVSALLQQQLMQVIGLHIITIALYHLNLLTDHVTNDGWVCTPPLIIIISNKPISWEWTT